MWCVVVHCYKHCGGLHPAHQIPFAIIADLDKRSKLLNSKKPAWFSVYKTVSSG